MKRELSPALFGDNSRSALRDGPIPPLSGQSVDGQTREDYESSAFLGADWAGNERDVHGNMQPRFLPNEIKSIEASMQSLKNQLVNLEKRFEQLSFQQADFSRGTAARFDRMHGQIARIEDAHSQSNQDVAQKQAFLLSKINERKMSDMKIQELVDRHNQLVRSFENRLTHLTRVLHDQEVALHNSTAALDEARQELARLKRS